MLEIKRISLTEMFEQEPCRRAIIWTHGARCYVMADDVHGSYDYFPDSFIAARDANSENLPPFIILFRERDKYIGTFAYSKTQSDSKETSVWCNINISETDIKALLDKINELTENLQTK